MEKILKDFLDNDEALDAYVDSKTTYLSVEDVDGLLKRSTQQMAERIKELERDNSKMSHEITGLFASRKAALDLLNESKQEIERLKGGVKELSKQAFPIDIVSALNRLLQTKQKQEG